MVAALVLAACVAGEAPGGAESLYDSDSKSAITESTSDSANDSVPTLDSGDSTTDDIDLPCPDPGERPSGVGWLPTGLADVAGFATLATNGLFPLYLGSDLTGALRLPAPDAPSWFATSVEPTTHTLGDLVVVPGEPFRLYRSAGGHVMRSDDGADTWKATAFGDRTSGNAFYGHTYGIAVPLDDTATVYAILDTGLFGVSTDLGENWEARGSIPLADLEPDHLDFFKRYRITAGRTGSDAILLHDGTYLWRSLDEGWNWTAILENPGNPDAMVRNPANPDESVAPAGMYTDDAGETWTDGGFGTIDRAFWGDRLWTFGDGVLRSWEGGVATEKITPTLEPTALAAAGDDVWITSETEAFHSADAGESWVKYEGSLVETDFVVVTPHPTCVGVAWVGTRCDGGLYRTVDWGRSWDRIDVDAHYVMDIVFDPEDDDTIWLVNDDQLLVTRDDGASWEELWAAWHFHGFAFDPENADHLLMGSVGSGNYGDTSGQLYISDDHGLSWRLATGIPQNTASAHTIAFLDGDRVLAGFYLAGDPSHLYGSGIGIYRSEDRGETWEEAPAPHTDIARILWHQGVVWAAAGDGLYRSDDRGESWTKVLEGWAFWVDMVGDTGFVVFMESVAYMTVDGGATWTQVHNAQEQPVYNPLERIVITPAGDLAWWTRYRNGVYQMVL